MISKKNKKFIDKINDAIRDETYDDLDMSEWEIIEELLTIIDTLSQPSVPSDEQIKNETLKVMLTNDEWMNLPDYYVKQIVVEVFHNLITKGESK